MNYINVGIVYVNFGFGEEIVDDLLGELSKSGNLLCWSPQMLSLFLFVTVIQHISRSTSWVTGNGVEIVDDLLGELFQAPPS